MVLFGLRSKLYDIKTILGWLEFMLDRRLVQDDWRGIGEGVEDNVMTKSTFFLLFEQLHRPSKVCKLSWNVKLIHRVTGVEG